MAPRPERLTLSGPQPVLSNSLAAYAKHWMDIHFWPSLSRDTVNSTPQCERLEQRIPNSFMSLAPVQYEAPLALEYPPEDAEHSHWNMSHGRAHSKEYSTHSGPYEQEPSVALMSRLYFSTRPMHSSGCGFREPAEPHGSILSGAVSIGMSASTMAQSLMNLRGTCLLGEIAADLRRELFLLRDFHILL